MVFTKQKQPPRSPLAIAISSALASITSTVITNPIEVKKLNQHIIPLTCPEYPLKCNSYIYECICNSSSLKHLLFSGLSVVVPQILISNAIFIQLYEIQRNLLVRSEQLKDRGSVATVLAAASSRLITSSIMAPVEAKRVRMSSHTDNKQKRSFKERFSSLKITVQRDVIFSCIYWTIIEAARNQISGGKEYRDQPKSNKQIWWLNLLPGFVGGLCASTITNPIDVVKTRVQTQSRSYTSMLGEIEKIYSKEGMRGLYLGIHMRVLKSSIHNALYLTLYETLLSVFKKERYY